MIVINGSISEQKGLNKVDYISSYNYVSYLRDYLTYSDNKGYELSFSKIVLLESIRVRYCGSDTNTSRLDFVIIDGNSNTLLFKSELPEAPNASELESTISINLKLNANKKVFFAILVSGESYVGKINVRTNTSQDSEGNSIVNSDSGSIRANFGNGIYYISNNSLDTRTWVKATALSGLMPPLIFCVKY